MLKPIITFCILITLTTLIGCSTDDKASVNPSGGAPTATPADPNIVYGTGFSDLEKGSDASWRWMSDEGIVKLKNTKKDMRLRITGAVPMNQIPKSTLTVTLNGEQLDQFPGAQAVDKEYSIPAAKQGSGATSELKIKTDKVFIPKEADKKATDNRRLGFSLTNLVWEAK